jgi:hypothetical protein
MVGLSFLMVITVQYSLFSLGMFTYTYERQDIIKIALKRLPGGGERRKKKGLSDKMLFLLSMYVLKCVVKLLFFLSIFRK